MTVLRRIATLLAALVATAALSLPGATAAFAAPATTLGLTPAGVDSFSLDAGKPQWAAGTRDRLRRTVFTVSSAGTFRMDQPDGYPTLTGTFSEDGTFEGSASSSVGSTGGTDSAVSGRITATGGTVRMHIVYTGGSVTAAVVNGTAFGDNRTKAYTASMTMRAA